jgi:hypothetical protein
MSAALMDRNPTGTDYPVNVIVYAFDQTKMVPDRTDYQTFSVPLPIPVPSYPGGLSWQVIDGLVVPQDSADLFHMAHVAFSHAANPTVEEHTAEAAIQLLGLDDIGLPRSIPTLNEMIADEFPSAQSMYERIVYYNGESLQRLRWMELPEGTVDPSFVALFVKQVFYSHLAEALSTVKAGKQVNQGSFIYHPEDPVISYISQAGLLAR